jgi:hypothetical protein
MPMPTVGGHEAAGVVVEVGPEVALTRVGARVVLSAIPTCGHCRWCNEGKSYLCDVNAVQMRGTSPDGSYRSHLDGRGCHSDEADRCVLPVRDSEVEPGDRPARRGLVRSRAMVGRGVPTGYGAAIHDYSYPTFLLTHWTRDRAAGRITIAEAVRMLTSVPADLVGLRDRGRLRVGAKADLNVIDYDALGLEQPRLERDLAAGGRRLHQGAVGYRATIVGGQCITVDGRATGRLHGRRVRAVNATVRAANSVFGLLC